MQNRNGATRGTRGSLFNPEVLQAQQPDVTPQPVETTASSSSTSSIPKTTTHDPRVLDALNRLAKAEAWLEDHDDEHPQWPAAVARLRTIIGELTELEMQGAAIDW